MDHGDDEEHTASTSRLYRAYKSGSPDRAKGLHPEDRGDARDIIAALPSMVTTAQANVEMLRRAVAAAAADGIDQIIDIGCDLPSDEAPPLHDVLRARHPGAASALVDHDPYVVAHATALLAGDGPATSVVEADAREPAALVDRVRAAGTIDFSRPVCTVFGALFHFVDYADAGGAGPEGIVAELAAAAAPGSWIVCTHGSADLDPDAAAVAARMYHALGLPGRARTRAQVEQAMSATRLLPPGVVPAAEWRPDGATTPYTPAEAWIWSAAGRV
ncbi:SAM-dependent methyltransferase [Nocardiopsis coralliicola]